MTHQRGVPVLPDPSAAIEPWLHNPETHEVTVSREAEHWTAHRGGKVSCQLCYRACFLKPGERGWCKYRGNENGRMTLYDHGILSRSQRLLLGYGGICTYHLGEPALGIGGTRCTARCSYCASQNVVWNPDRIPWANDMPNSVGTHGAWWLVAKAILPPAAVIEVAQAQRAGNIVFAENEPLLSWEYTYDVARLAKQHGLGVVVYSNGFSTPQAIAHLAPYVDAVDLGVKGSLSLAFYEKYMRSPGSVEHVKRSALEWRRHGVHLLMSDLIATQYMQSDDEHAESADALYRWVAVELGPHTPVMIGHIHAPEGTRADVLAGDEYGRVTRYLMVREEDAPAYWRRFSNAKQRAQAAGLPYAFLNQRSEPIHCHSCGALLMQRHKVDCQHEPCIIHDHEHDYCTCWSHELHVTADSRCASCGVAVPIVPAYEVTT